MLSIFMSKYCLHECSTNLRTLEGAQKAIIELKTFIILAQHFH